MRRGREHLIPFEQSERVIRLERRGKKSGISVCACIMEVLGALCLLYCAVIAFAGFGTWFFLIWGIMGAVLAGAGFLLRHTEFAGALPRGLKLTLAGVLGVALLLFLVVEGLILSRFGSEAAPGADYCIILGAQWKDNGPSEVLRRRLERALEYLKENPETMVVVSGGQGSNEVMSEAAGMKQYLMAAGIAEERILMEDRSGNTSQNLKFSAGLIDTENSRVVIVTNNFHMFRALGIARKQGYSAEGLSAGSVIWMLPNNMLREFLGVLKDFVVGNL